VSEFRTDRNTFDFHNANGWFVVAVAVVTSIYVFYLARRLKYVSLEGSALSISDYGQPISIPLQNVERVWADLPINVRIGGPLIHIETRVPTPFGQRIDFAPMFSMGYRRHPLAQELTDMVRKAKGIEP
jgi:hypothetical protein